MSTALDSARLAIAPYVLYLKLAVLVFAVGAYAWQGHQLTKARADAATCITDRNNFAKTQTGNLAKIDGLIHDFNVLAEARRVEAKASADALRRVDVAAAQSEAKADALEQRLRLLYAQDKDASAWGQMGVDASVAAELPGGGKR